MSSSNSTFGGSPTRAFFKGGLLFDMDGTIIDSTSAVEKLWHIIGKEIGVDPAVILETSHGRRSIDTLGVLCPERANWKYIKEMEGSIPKNYGGDAAEIPGARALLDQIKKDNVPWAIVTSGTTPLVSGWLDVLKLPTPENLVVAEDVKNGKPDPACYLMGMEKLDATDPSQVLVLEDSPAGIRAGKAAGCKVLGLVTSHTIEQVVAAGPDWVVKDLSSVKVVGFGERGVELELRDTLVTH
ncbi:probable glycerol-3-phosphate phosphatase (glycerol-1-phosphatase) [Rhynchosporium secalis]|uniref:Probable glycerol-3-phosphate phosphatase (Glycerol-1-phosphatase) n=1 Tax=Rhynchosporium secalis TaxID=38038 RepID=A0A1E1MMH6_RHYSE|nr:probable glycerol-3-phosphate phosphatase (glycerol-1-phosphatase) [Rhynchosporium secalis]